MYFMLVCFTQIKCYKYWPDEKTQKHEKLRIMHQETLQLAEYTVRTFSLQRENSKEERIVRQFHFTAWPDHGVPEYPSPLLGFVRKVMNSNPQNAGPMVVHCSAGVGRTGTFITLHCQLQKIQTEGALDIFGFVRGMRRNRCFMVQTEVCKFAVYCSRITSMILFSYSLSSLSMYSFMMLSWKPSIVV